MNWMEEKIGDLEKQRDSELKRLSDMFEKNTDEALKYAIPLNSKYLSRGTAKPSAQLTKRSLHFNLGRLGGGYAIDGWNVDNYYDDLRRKYLMAAQNAIEEKDFKKAAYVYAHLLGDYTAAADTLRRGKHYREAAVLYKEHLKNLSMAAICLEEGGMYPEAIEMYTGLNQHEKAGDLYMTLDQKEPALECYEKCVLAAAANKDHLEESRIITDKIGDRSRAKKVLLQGWKDIKQPEACLIKYFDLVADDDKKEVHNAVKAFYANNELAKKEMSFLNVLDKVNQKYKTTELESACQDIAYEIVSEQVNAGNPASLHTLRNFVPGDQLLAPDCFRFIHTFKEVPKQKPTPHQWQLMKEVQWHKALVWNNQLLVWGTKPSGLLLARMSWEGHIEHFNWYLIKPDRPLLPIANPGHSNHILLYGRNESITEKWLPVNKYFQDELIVLRPGFIEANAIGVGFRESEIAVLYQQHGEGFLNYITPGGAVNESIHCTFNDVGNNFSLPPVAAGEMMWCDGNFYLACGQTLLRISEKGAIDVLYYVEAPIQKMAVNKWSHEITIAIAFDNHVLILTGDNDNEYEGPYEVEGIQVADLTFLPDDSLVLAGKKEVQVLNAPTWELDWQMETENDVIGVFPGPLRDQIGILESTGQITLHRIRELE
jgi:tetratricopeptide (TPR) repeat protein